jgi:hypothetical protein
MKRLLLLLLFTNTILVGQSRDELKRKYGQPVSETFTVRPGILVTATYGPAGKTVELVIATQNTAIIKSRAGSVITKETATAIIDELVPKGERGKYVIGEFDHITCLPDDDCNGVSEHYEKLTIYYNAVPEGKVHYAVVRWKQ